MTQHYRSTWPLAGLARTALAAGLLSSLFSSALAAPPATLVETPMFREEVAAKKLPPVKQRLPENQIGRAHV